MTSESINFITEVAENFWRKADLTPTYPLQYISLEQSVLLTQHVTIIKLSKLSAFKVVSWLAERNFLMQVEKDYALCGLLFINKGHGFIFINGTHSPDEQCYTLAHELGHFLLEFEYPRQRAEKVFSSKINEVFRAIRNPTVEEELIGIISGVNIFPYIHFIEEDNQSVEAKWKVWDVENRADSLAFELIAPLKEVSKRIKSRCKLSSFTHSKKILLDTLLIDFELPPSIAKQYATSIAYRLFPHGNGLIERLKSL